MKRNLIGLGGLVVLAAICGFGGWWLFRPASASSPPGDDVAMVNGEAITRAQLEFQIATRQRANELNPSIAVPSWCAPQRTYRRHARSAGGCAGRNQL